MLTQFFSILVLLGSGLVSFAGEQTPTQGDMEKWLIKQRRFSERQVLRNISPAGARIGAVLASPSRHDPDYYFHWVRDSAIVMDVWMRQLEGSYPASMPIYMTPMQLEMLLWDYVMFTDYGQGLPTRDDVGVGEPRYNVDGTPNMLDWSRPQNDGPAMRASVMIRFVHYLKNKGQEAAAFKRVWPVIKRDLEYTAIQIRRGSFDIWEEMRGDHFYTRVGNRAALLSGSALAAEFGEVALSAWYSTQAQIAESLALAHLNSSTQSIVENTHWEAGHDYKHGGIDTASLLAFLHTQEQPILMLSHPYLRNTMNKLEQAFQNIYDINRSTPQLAAAIGRYPEDRYYDGNPWFLTTLAFAEYHYRLGDRELGDKYMMRVMYHTDAAGHMSEQMSRRNGYMLSAHDLTWSYVAFLTALEARVKYTFAKKEEK